MKQVFFVFIFLGLALTSCGESNSVQRSNIAVKHQVIINFSDNSHVWINREEFEGNAAIQKMESLINSGSVHFVVQQQPTNPHGEEIYSWLKGKAESNDAIRIVIASQAAGA